MPTYVAVALIVDQDTQRVLLLDQPDGYRLPGIVVQGATSGYQTCVQRLTQEGFHLLSARRYDPEMLQEMLRESVDAVIVVGDEVRIPSDLPAQEEFAAYICHLIAPATLKTPHRWFSEDELSSLNLNERPLRLLLECLSLTRMVA